MKSKILVMGLVLLFVAVFTAGSPGAKQAMCIRANMTVIGDFAFNYYGGLTSFTVLATTPPALRWDNIFEETHSNLRIEAPAASVEAYNAAPDMERICRQDYRDTVKTLISRSLNPNSAPWSPFLQFIIYYLPPPPCLKSKNPVK